MSKFMVASASLVILIIQSQFYNAGVRAESGDLKVTTTVEPGAPDWVRSFADSTFYLHEGKIVNIATSNASVRLDSSGENIEVTEGDGSEVKVFENAVFDPEITAEYPTISNVHDLFLRNYRWSKYDENIWESYEPVILKTSDGVKQIKVWMFMSSDGDMADKVSIIDQDSNLYSIHLKYERPVE